MKRDAVDFHQVPEAQQPIHGRLLNWARWCRNSAHGMQHPMWRFYKPPREGVNLVPESSEPINAAEAWKVQQVVKGLPELYRHAIQWFYVFPVSPRRKAKELGLTVEGLAQAVIDARNMMRNRGA